MATYDDVQILTRKTASVASVILVFSEFQRNAR